MSSHAINLNDTVRVTLTEKGRALYRAFHLKWSPSYKLPTSPTIEIPLWEFMQIFGPAIHMGMHEVPTVGNVLEVLTRPGSRDSVSVASVPSVVTPVSAAERIEWHYLPELPDDETTVLLAHETDDTDQPVIGYHKGNTWYWSNPVGRDVPAYFNVYAWAHLPANPSKKDGAS